MKNLIILSILFLFSCGTDDVENREDGFITVIVNGVELSDDANILNAVKEKKTNGELTSYTLISHDTEGDQNAIVTITLNADHTELTYMLVEADVIDSCTNEYSMGQSGIEMSEFKREGNTSRGTIKGQFNCTLFDTVDGSIEWSLPIN